MNKNLATKTRRHEGFKGKEHGKAEHAQLLSPFYRFLGSPRRGASCLRVLVAKIEEK